MALFIRDDGLRFLLGSGAYEFKDSQLMFAGNTIENDVVAVQGNDGYMLAGQVRRPSTQVFDGYIGDASVPKSEVEGYRRDFMAFFQKNHFYTVVYVMADGSAIQRRRGFLVDAPTSQELWQMYPEYHVALNFEDVNYYKYSENDDGEETYAKSADIGLAKVQYGGLIWAESSSTQVYNSGTDFSISGTEDGKQVDYIDLYGDTEQQTYTGKNLYEGSPSFNAFVGVSGWEDGGTYNGMPVIKRAGAWGGAYKLLNVEAGNTYTFSLWIKADQARQGSIYSSGSSSGATATISPNAKTLNISTNWERVSLTFECSASGTVALRVENWTSSDTNYTYIAGYQLEVGSSMTSFEPYVGGVASPNPDYPQNVDVVTGRQVVTVSDGGSQSQEYEINLGKNLFDKDNANTIVAYIQWTTPRVLNYSSGNTSVYIPCQPNTTYTISKVADNVFRAGSIEEEPTTGITVYNAEDNPTGTSITITTSSKAKYIVVFLRNNSSTNSLENILASLQIEKGSTATTYASYFTPIELCKIGTYQDKIYKSGEDWYIHKEINKVVLDGTENWTDASTYGYTYTRGQLDNFALVGSGCFCNMFTQRTGSHGQYEYIWVQPTSGSLFLQISDSRLSAHSLDAFKTWLGTNKPVVYSVLATPTDTQITNSALIAQLEALNEATTYDGITWFRSESLDLPAILWAYVTIQAGGGVVWDENGAEWEAGGGGEIVVVNVDSIENILPVWTIRGEAENPTLTNLTTGMSITYNGTVASGQTLVIDLLNKTAKLNGTSVISDVSGQWVEFQPGNNRVSYSAENADAPDSTIEWQEVVG